MLVYHRVYLVGLTSSSRRYGDNLIGDLFLDLLTSSGDAWLLDSNPSNPQYSAVLEHQPQAIWTNCKRD